MFEIGIPVLSATTRLQRQAMPKEKISWFVGGTRYDVGKTIFR
jgi:hypothetical protein